MSTFLTLRNRVTSELDRDDLSAEASVALVSAVRFYEVDNWGFNQTLTSTIFRSETLSTPADFLHETYVKIQRSGNYYHLEKKTFHEIQDMRYNDSHSSIPSYFCIFGDKFYFYPTPEQTYSLFIAYTMSLDHTVSSSTGYTNELEELIRTHAKVDLLENVILGPEAAQEAAKLNAREQRVYDRKKARRVLEASSNRVKKRGIF